MRYVNKCKKGYFKLFQILQLVSTVPNIALIQSASEIWVLQTTTQSIFWSCQLPSLAISVDAVNNRKSAV